MGTAGRESSEPGAGRFSGLGVRRKTGLREPPHVTGLGLTTTKKLVMVIVPLLRQAEQGPVGSTLIGFLGEWRWPDRIQGGTGLVSFTI